VYILKSSDIQSQRSRVEKINAEVVALTYGTIVAQLCRDLTLPNTANQTDYAAVNAELDRMGYNIGLRLIEDFLAKSSMTTCTNFKDTADIVSKVGFKMFLNITPTVTGWDKENRSFHLVFDENPLADFVELPDDGRAQDELWYSNILCGVIRGALEMVRLREHLEENCYLVANVSFRCNCRWKCTSRAMCYEEMTRLRCAWRWCATLRTNCLRMTSRTWSRSGFKADPKLEWLDHPMPVARILHEAAHELPLFALDISLRRLVRER
jgi:trafficking protein particle complex subunit 3